jgi:ABC-type phosphate transport system substrate-binding protein
MRARATAAVVLGLVALGGLAQAGDVAIIVHRNHPQDALTMAELSRIFRMEQQHWKSGDRIEVVLQASGSEKDAIVQSRVLGLRPSELQAFWLGKTFRGEITAAPRSLASDLSVKQVVGASLRAVGYVDSLLLDDSVKALKIEGKSPGESGYPLARGAGR